MDLHILFKEVYGQALLGWKILQKLSKHPHPQPATTAGCRRCHHHCRTPPAAYCCRPALPLTAAAATGHRRSPPPLYGFALAFVSSYH
ncbi:hypothetical protein HanIR_Chr09g0399661 [Helianthus annuus]|nr:hypothetical protein HanIR_Chr09g0399661 [Helianthus annuus]